MTREVSRTSTDGRTVISASFFRTTRDRVHFADAPPVAPEPIRRPARVAQQLALAHHLQNAIDRGAVADRTTIALRLGVTKARITQLLDLTLLAPDLQEKVLAMEAVDGVEPMSERALRKIAQISDWAEQRRLAAMWRGNEEARLAHGGDGKSSP
jgi:hypothetical protein